MRSAMKDRGVESSGVVNADSSAALAIANRRGAGKLRHVNISALWIQEKQDLHQLEMRKILGTENPADLMTKHLTRSVMDTHFGFLSQRRESGRAKSGLNIQGSEQSRNEVLATASGASAPHYVIDNWLQTPTPHQLWPEPWTGETHFEASDGVPRSLRHTSARRALATPPDDGDLTLPIGVKWTGNRCTLINPISHTSKSARGTKPSANIHSSTRERSGDQPASFNNAGQGHKRRIQSRSESTPAFADWPSETRVPTHGRRRLG